MPRDINQRLNALNARRKGTDRLSSVAMDSASQILAKAYIPESYQARAKDKPHTRYALGSMQEVDPDYTRISIQTAERVGKQLNQALGAAGCPVEFRLQGSVPLNIHIKGVSDVDLLTLDTSFRTYATAGSRSQLGLYTNPTSKTSTGVLTTIRQHSEKTLKEKYPAATVDTSGSKAINISGGSLQRPVDVVPSHWHDNISYQESLNTRDRTVTILNKHTMETIHNLPFLHIALVNEHDKEAGGGVKKAIRLCKSVRSDAEHEIDLAGFDIAALMCHANKNSLRSGYIYELSILAETQRFLDFLYHNEAHAKSLLVLDGSRCILDNSSKWAALTSLSVEMDALLLQVCKEQSSILAQKSTPLFEECRTALSSFYIP